MKLYVPNPQLWVDFFDRVSTGKSSLNQSGGGRQTRIIAVNQSKSTGDKSVEVKAVLPSEQTTAQAKSELEREDINPASVVNMVQKRSRRRRGGIKKRSGRTKRQRGGAKRRRVGSKQKRKQLKRVGRKNRKRDIFEIK